MSMNKKHHESILWGRVKNSHIYRNLPRITYTKKELVAWLDDNGYDALFKTWEKSKFEKDLAPSLDRLDTNIGYELSNLELVTWVINLQRAREDRKNGIGRMAEDNLQIVQVNSDGELVATYNSVSDASRKTVINRGNISSAVSGRLISAGGFYWISYRDYKRMNKKTLKKLIQEKNLGLESEEEISKELWSSLVMESNKSWTAWS